MKEREKKKEKTMTSVLEIRRYEGRTGSIGVCGVVVRSERKP
jgi:hypothetical protein